MSFLVNSHIPGFCSFHIGLLHGERNASVSILSVKVKKERIEREREREREQQWGIPDKLEISVCVESSSSQEG